MDTIFHFLMTEPENPATRHMLAEALEILLRNTHNEWEPGEKEFQWITNAMKMVEVASHRQKDDPLIGVNLVRD
jgi:hypothetical protein